MDKNTRLQMLKKLDEKNTPATAVELALSKADIAQEVEATDAFREAARENRGEVLTSDEG